MYSRYKSQDLQAKCWWGPLQTIVHWIILHPISNTSHCCYATPLITALFTFVNNENGPLAVVIGISTLSFWCDWWSIKYPSVINYWSVVIQMLNIDGDGKQWPCYTLVLHENCNWYALVVSSLLQSGVSKDLALSHCGQCKCSPVVIHLSTRYKFWWKGLRECCWSMDYRVQYLPSTCCWQPMQCHFLDQTKS